MCSLGPKAKITNLDLRPKVANGKIIMNKKIRVVTKFRTSPFQKKILIIRAKKAGLSLNEFCYRSVFEKKIIERLTDDQIEVYKMLITYHNNFKRIGNMFKKKDPNLSAEVYKLAEEIKNHLNNFN